MTNLLGPAGNQVPTNDMLGALAFMDEVPSSLIPTPTVNGLTLPVFVKTLLRVQFNTLALFRAVDSTLYTAAETRGYFAVEDGGHSAYLQIDTPANKANYTDNGGSIIITNDGYVWQYLPAQFGVDVRKFGAIPNSTGITNGTNCVAAILAADAFAVSTGQELLFPPGTTSTSGYLMSASTVTTLNSRVLRAPMPYMASSVGVRFYYAPTVTQTTAAPLNTPTTAANDNLACIRLVAPRFEVWNITIQGPTNYVLGTLPGDGYWPSGTLWSATPNYVSLGYGFVGFEVYGSAAYGTFRNCSSSNLKHGVLYNAASGNIHQVDCTFNGLVSTMVLINGSDYSFTGGTITGVLGGVGCWDSNGSAGISLLRGLRAVIGNTAIPFIQFHDSVNNGVNVSGMQVHLEMVRYQNIGEALFQGLPTSYHQFVTGTAQNSIWSSTVATASAGVTATILPAAMAPTYGTQQYLFRMGRCQRWRAVRGCFNNDTYNGGIISNASTAPYSTRKSVYCAALVTMLQDQYDDGVAPWDWSGVAGSVQIGDGTAVTFNNPSYRPNWMPRPESLLSSVPATRGDFRRRMAAALTPNLLNNPEQLNNWSTQNVTASVTALNTLVSSGDLSESQIPAGLRQELGPNPVVLKLVPTASGTTGAATISAWNNSQAALNEFVSMGCYLMVKSGASSTTTSAQPSVPIRYRLLAGGYVYPYDNTDYHQPGMFRRIIWEDMAAGARGDANNVYSGFNMFYNVTANLETVYLVGLMLNRGPLAAYNPNPLLAVMDGGLILNGPLVNKSLNVIANQASGFSHTVDTTVAAEFLNQTATVSTGTLVFPIAYRDQQTMRVTTAATITALTVSGSGCSVVGMPTTLQQGMSFSARYDLTANVWYPC